jgi:hypothetical protein
VTRVHQGCRLWSLRSADSGLKFSCENNKAFGDSFIAGRHLLAIYIEKSVLTLRVLNS